MVFVIPDNLVWMRGLFDSIQWDKSKHPRGEDGRFGVKSDLSKTVRQTMQSVRTDWGDFPSVHVLHKSGALKNHNETLYLQAKKGNIDAAFDVLLNGIVNNAQIDAIAEKIGDRQPILVPVLAIEQAGNNRIPLAFANIVGANLDLEVEDSIVQVVRANHTNAGAYERIVRQPIFDGAVQKGKDYVIMDDTIAMGGTLAALRGYIEHHGGHVILATALTGHFVPTIDIVPTPKMLNAIRQKHPKLDKWWQHEFGYPIDYLTQGELGHLKSPISFDEIRNRLVASGFSTSQSTSKTDYQDKN